MVKQAPETEKRVYTVEEIMRILEIGRKATYILIKMGSFLYVKIGGQYRISKKSFDKWLDGMKGGEM